MAPIASPAFCVNETGDPLTRDFISGVTILLALFGKDATNVFLSQSVSILDWVLFAIAPMGVPFAVLAVIRTSQMHFLKSVAGLSEDKPSHVEKDLMSSTSDEVSEKWDGEKVVRFIGPSRVSELFFTGFDVDQPSYGFYTTHDAKFCAGIMERKHEWTTDLDWELQLWKQNLDQRRRTTEEPDRCYPPNLMLNLGPYQRLPALWVFTILGLVSQGAVLVLVALIKFYPSMRECFHPNVWSSYVFIIGTVILFLGLVVCASAIDKASQDVLWKPTHPNLLIMWLQEGSDESSIEPSYVITKRIRKEVVSSHRPRGMSPRVRFPPVIIFFIVVGYLSQAISLSTLHWPPQALQFLTTVVMFLCRSFLRRQDVPDRAKEIRAGSCKDWVAKMCVLSPQRLYESPPPGDEDPDLTWILSPLRLNGDKSNRNHDDLNDADFWGCRCAQDLLEIRRFLARAAHDEGIHTKLASSLAQAITEISQSLADAMDVIACEEINRWTWEVGIQVDKQVPEPLELTLEKKEAWEANEQQLGALLSLLLSSINKKNARVPRISRLIIGPSSEAIPWETYSDAGLYQIPPQDPSKGLSITVDREVLLGVDDAITEVITEEENDEEVTFRASRIGAEDQPNRHSGAMIARISKMSVGQLYCQHIFVCFMWAIAKALRERGASFGSGPAMETLFRKIEFTGLGDFSFARLAITVPLHYYQLLQR